MARRRHAAVRFLADNWRARAALLGALAMATAAASCKDGPGEESTQDPPSPTDTTPSTWDPSGDAGECNVDALLEPYSYGSKVKTLLTGLPLDDAELKALEQDPSQLKSMIQGWLALPEADTTLTRFFMTAFQQTSGDRVSLFYLLGRNATAVGSYTNPQSPTADEML